MSKDKLNPNKIVQYLDKSPEEFTKKDLMKFIEDNNIQMLNFRYLGADGKLKILNFVINSRTHLDKILSIGERVDGSSLFPYIDAGSSDLYVIPRYKTAFVNPFSSIPTVDILCSYYNNEGQPLGSAPENILKKSHTLLKNATGFTMEALGELEYYIFYNKNDLYQAPPQKGYHESFPFSKGEMLRCEAMQAIAQAGGKIKYGHGEVGNIYHQDNYMEQHEIEFLPVNVEDAADQIAIAKWILRNIGYKYGVTISFAPKIMVGHAGSGMHIHTRLIKDGKNLMIENGKLSDTAKKVIAGYLTLAPALTAFGNTVPTSYLRLVPHQEAPTNICWGDKNRSVLVRVPLGWLNVPDMIKSANPAEDSDNMEFMDNQTVEFRCPDGSTDIYLLLSGLVVAAKHGLDLPDALEIARKLYVDVNIFSSEYKDLQQKMPQLPSSCWESADKLLLAREIFEKDGVFPSVVIDGIVNKLKKFDDRDLSTKLYGEQDKLEIVNKYLHCS